MYLPPEAWSAMGGAFVVGLFSAITTYINKRSEERKHFQEIVIKSAIEEWKHVSQISASPTIFPLANYVIHAVKICELALNKNTTPQNIKTELDKIYSLMDIIDKYVIDRVKKTPA